MPDDFQACNNIRVLEPNHCLYLCVPHCGLPRSELPLKSLESVNLLGFLIGDLVHDTKAALAKRF